MIQQLYFSFGPQSKTKYQNNGSKYSPNSVEVKGKILSVIIKRIFTLASKPQVHVASKSDYRYKDDHEYQSTVANDVGRIITMAPSKVKRLTIADIYLWTVKNPIICVFKRTDSPAVQWRLQRRSVSAYY
ncbi:hypothetical protein BX070DRAFT_252544 [Coemansia spiralis]|nr:hypothetical protein BX070DRAFT_252544 [Coemansia spiralis]